MNLPRSARWLLSLASGFLLAFSLPDYNWPVLAWVAVALLLVAVSGAGVREAAFCGWLHGAAFYPATLPWIFVVMRQYGNLDAVTAAAVLGLLAAVGGLLSGAFTAGFVFIESRKKGWGFLAAPFLWVAIEEVRTHLPDIGFPWNLSGYAAAQNLALMQLAPWMGVYGLSFLIVAFNALLAWAFLRRDRRSIAILTAAIIILTCVAAIGPRFVPTAAPSGVAHLVQTDFPQSESYPANWMALHAADLDQLERISVDAARRAPGPVIWPEVPAPFSFLDPRFAARMQRIVHDGGQPLLVGVVEWRPNANLSAYHAFNSVVLLDSSGQRTFTYDKIHLVPFGEYVPWRKWIPFAGRLTADISDFTPGASYRTGEFPGGPFGVFICYESIFPAEVRRFVLNGAQLLINVSNDGWFGRSAAPAQHLLMVRVRAAENRRWILRDTNNGYTVSIDPYGRIVAALPTDVRGQLDAPYAFRTGLSIYTRCGDWVAWLSIIVSLVFLLAASRRRAMAAPGSET
jgi:apolipoprotein N-acyltransferase